MIASCGMRARRLLIVEKTAAPMKVNARLIQYTDRRVRIAARDWHQHRDRRAERGNLGQRQVHEDDAALDDMDAEIGVDAGENEAGDERRREKFENGSQVHGYLTPTRLMAAMSVLMS